MPSAKMASTTRGAELDLRRHRDGWQARLTTALDDATVAFEDELLRRLSARQEAERRAGSYELALYQRHAWLRRTRHEHRLFQLRDPEGRAALQVALLVARPRRAPMLAHARAHRLGPGTSTDAEAMGMLLLRELCAEAGDLVSLRLQPCRLRPAPLAALEHAALGAGYRRVEPVGVTRTLFVPLRPSADELMRALSKKTRAKIRHAGRRGCDIRPLTDPRWAPAMASAVNASLARTGGGLVQYDIPTALALAADEPTSARAFGVFMPDRPNELLAFVLGVRHGQVAEYALAGSHPDATPRALPFNYWLLWELIGWARDAGAVVMDLGGITPGGPDDPRAGISRFKRHFSEDEREVGRELEVDLLPARATALRAWQAWHRWRQALDVRDVVRTLVPGGIKRLRHAVSATAKTMLYAPRAALVDLHPATPVTYQLAAPEELRQLDDRHGYDDEAITLLERRMAQGDRLVLGHRRGQIIFSGWLSVGRMELPRAHVELPGGMAYAYKLFTPPEHRGAGLMRGFYGFVARELLTQDSPGVVACVVTGNDASLEAHRRVGFTPIGTFWDLRAGGAALAVTDEAIAGHIGRRFAAAVGD